MSREHSVCVQIRMFAWSLTTPTILATGTWSTRCRGCGERCVLPPWTSTQPQWPASSSASLAVCLTGQTSTATNRCFVHKHHCGPCDKQTEDSFGWQEAPTRLVKLSCILDRIEQCIQLDWSLGELWLLEIDRSVQLVLSFWCCTRCIDGKTTDFSDVKK